MADILFVTSEPLHSIDHDRLRSITDAHVVVLMMSGKDDPRDVPPSWTSLASYDLIDSNQVAQQFLDFLENWPKQIVEAGRTFDEVFTTTDGHSLWWTSVGANRHPDYGPFRYFRALAMVDQAIEQVAPTKVVLFTHERVFAELVKSRAAHSRLPFEWLSGEVHEARSSKVGWGWAVGASRRACVVLIRRVLSSLRCRWALRHSQLFRPSRRPTVAFWSRFNRYLSIRDGRFSPVNWKEIASALQELGGPGIDQAYLPRKLADVSDRDSDGQPRRGADVLSRLRAPLLIRERFVPLRDASVSVVRQVSAAFRFRRLARRGEFRESFRFANTDMAPLLLPELKEAIEGIVEWSFKMGQWECALRAAGEVSAIIVAEEMYPPSMPVMAAAARLGIPTIGVQHGNIMPYHLLYRVPPGHVRHAPIPDYFAAYGQYAKTILSVHGAYPADRIWITGAARLDPLISQSVDSQKARALLKLPHDKKIVVLAAQTFAWFSSAIRGVVECLRDHPDAILCIKKHPSGRALSMADLQSLTAAATAPDVRTYEGDLDLLLRACDVWISASSTTILEATLLGKRSICLNLTGEPDRYPYVEDGASLPARSLEQLKQSLTRVLAPPDERDIERRAAFLRKHAGPTTEGRAALVLAQQILDVCVRNDRPPVLPTAPSTDTDGETISSLRDR